MSSSDRQPESLLMEEFGGRQAELVDKLSEISTSMRQCADIVDSFSRIVRQISFWPMAPDTAAARQPSGLGHSRGVGSALGPAYERLDPASIRPESVGSPSQVQGAEAYRRPSHFAAGSMHPPAIPTFHSAALPGLSSMSAPPTFPHPRPSSATSAAGPIDAGGLARFTIDATASASERRASSTKHGKRKRPQPAESGGFGEDSGGETGTDASPRADVYEGTSEIDHPIRQPMRHPAGGLEETLGARVFSPKGHAAAEGSRTEHRASDSATGPSIVVFSSGSGPSKSRAVPARAPGPSSSSRSRKEKKPRDPNAPKQPPPAYIVYQNEIRETMRARFPTHSPTELVKEIAATWKTLSNAERQQYKDQANIEKDRWVAELAAYQASLAPPDEAQAGKSSEGTFLATVGVSDSPPPASSPRQSPGLSDMEVEYKPRLTTSQDMPSSNPYPAPVRGAASFPGPGVAALPPSLSPTSESRSGRSSRQGYSYGPDNPPRPERALSRHGYPAAPAYGHMPMPSATASRPHLLGHMEPRTSSTRLPGIGSLGLTPQQGVREPSPGPARERSETEGEPASKRQRTGTNPSSGEEEGSGGLNRSAREGLESE